MSTPMCGVRVIPSPPPEPPAPEPHRHFYEWIIGDLVCRCGKVVTA